MGRFDDPLRDVERLMQPAARLVPLLGAPRPRLGMGFVLRPRRSMIGRGVGFVFEGRAKIGHVGNSESQRSGEDTLAPVKVKIISMFPEYFLSPLRISLVAKAIEAGHLEVEVVDLREYGQGVHRQLDDAPYGGGPGMVMMVEPLSEALDPLAHTHKVLFAAAGVPLTQATLDRWAHVAELTLVCGRYEGVDQRVADHLVDEEVSLGDYVLLGGEAAALAVVEGVTRLLPGVVGNPDSVATESFRDGLLEEPHYTRPAEFRGWVVPDVLLSGDHGRIAAWRLEQRQARTAERRPDLLESPDRDGSGAGGAGLAMPPGDG